MKALAMPAHVCLGAAATRSAIALLMCVTVLGCGGDSNDSRTPNSPSAPTTPAATRIIELEGELNFGDVGIGSAAEKTIRIVNRGNDTLAVTGLSGLNAFTANWTSGNILSNQWRDITVRFVPTAEQSYNGTMTVNANHTSGGNTMTISARGIRTGPRTQFGAGMHLVGTDIAPGRYFSDPSSGCYWARLSGLGGTLGEILSNEFIGSNARQWIVDIRASDRAFESDSDCGIWFNTPRHGTQSTIADGVWLVGAQLAPGDYRADVRSGCYWERLRHFDGSLDAILASVSTQTRTAERGLACHRSRLSRKTSQKINRRQRLRAATNCNGNRAACQDLNGFSGSGRYG
jgi:hypothetical protein